MNDHSILVGVRLDPQVGSVFIYYDMETEELYIVESDDMPYLITGFHLEGPVKDNIGEGLMDEMTKLPNGVIGVVFSFDGTKFYISDNKFYHVDAEVYTLSSPNDQGTYYDDCDYDFADEE